MATVVPAKCCCGVGEIDGARSFEAAADVEKLIANNMNNGILFATTQSRVGGNQVLEYIYPEQALRDAGFVCTEFDNPNTGNTLKFWLKVVHPPGSLDGSTIEDDF